MKRIIKICTVCFVLIFCLSFGAILSPLFMPTNMQIEASNDDDLSKFLQFEQSVIELNNQNELKTQSITSTASNEEDVDLELVEQENDFSFKRLIVQGEIKNNYGAINVISYNDLHILCYSSKGDTKNAYEQLSKDSSLSVIIDKEEKLEEYAEQDYDYTSYTNWGGKAIDVGGYRQFLVDNSVDKEIVVVVLDTGINTSHPMFTDRLLTDSEGKIRGFSYYNSTYQYSYDNLAFDVDDASTTNIDEGDANKYSFEDDNGHGTHVAGIICDLTPSNVKILPIKIGNSGGTSTSSIMISAYLRVLNIYSKQYTIACTNLSFSGGGKTDEADKKTFNTQCYGPLMEKNILSITAAGNESDENNIEGLKAVVVSALKQSGNQYVFDNGYSNYGKIIDISAPGTAINSAWISDVDEANSSLKSIKGTSMASPQVAGVTALLYLNPNLKSNFTASDIEQMLYDNSLDMGAPDYDIYYGYGILNLKYFEVNSGEETLSFYRDSSLVSEYNEYENFETAFTLEIRCSDSDFKIIYSLDKSIPTLASSTSYSSAFTVEESIYIYAMGVKVESGQIVKRTKLYNISYFNSSTPLEECFTIRSDGRLFDYTGYYTHLTIPETINGITINKIGLSLFKCSNLKSITLPDTVTTISGYAFEYCYDLEYIYAPGVTEVAIAGFYHCRALTFVSDSTPSATDNVGAFFPNLTSTVGFTFSGCTNLETVSLSKLEAMGTASGSEEGCDFQSCSNLKSVNLPNITSIPQYTFFKCENLETFNIGEFVESIGLLAFYSCKIKSFSLDEDNNYLYTDNTAIYSSNSLAAFPCGNEDIDYEILSSVKINGVTTDITSISNYVMYDAKINSLTIPASITNIGKSAFGGSQINTLYYNATNCSSSGYYDEENRMIATPFNEIETIEIGANVEEVPTRLFQDAFPNYLIINSHSTIFNKQCFYFPISNVLKRLTFDFIGEIDGDYLDMVIVTSSLYASRDIESIYSKSEVPLSSCSSSRVSNLKYSTYDSDSGYYIYSNTPLASLTITASSGAGGQISPSGSVSVNSGESKTFTFTPNTGYHVSSITIDGTALSGTDLTNAINNGYTFSNITSAHTISVTFAKDTDVKYTVKHWKESLTSSGATQFGTKYYKLEETDSSKSGVTGELTEATANSYTGFTAQAITQQTISGDGSTVVNVLYNRNSYTVTLVKGTGIDTVSGAGSYLYGQTVTLSATLLDGYNWTSWNSSNTSVLANSSNINYNFTMPASAITLTAVATKETVTQYTITVSAGANGTISPATDQTVNSGESITFKFTPKTGCYVSSIKVDGTALSGTDLTNAINNGYTFSNVTSNHSINVTFGKYGYSISASTGANGKISPEGTTSVLHGESLTYTFTPNFGYKVKDVKIDGVSVGPRNSYTFVNVTSSHTISVEYEIKKITISVSIKGKGNIQSDKPLENIAPGEDRTFTITVEEGWEISEVKENGIVIPVTDNKFTIFNIGDDIDIQITFKQKVVPFEWDKKSIAIVAGAALFLILLLILIIKKHKKAKRRRLEQSMQKTLPLGKAHNSFQEKDELEDEKTSHKTKETPRRELHSEIIDKPLINVSTPEARAFAKGREQNFKAYCKKFNVDYENDYDNAAKKYYQAYLRSNKTNNPPKNNK